MFNFLPWDWARMRTCLSMFAPSPRRGFPLWRTCSWLQPPHPLGQGFQVSGAQWGARFSCQPRVCFPANIPKELIRNYFPPCIKAELLAWTPWFLEGQGAYWDGDRVTGHYLPPEAAQECA